MSCEEIRGCLSDYCDGDISTAQQSRVERHLATCGDCRAELDSLRSLIDRASAMRLDVEPQRDLWPQIEAHLRSRRGPVLQGRWWQSPVVRLAAAALVGAVALMMARRPEAPALPPLASVPAVEEAAGHASLALASEEARVEDGLMQVREDLLRAISTRRDEMDPMTRDLVDKNLEIIDRAIGELYRAIEQDPESRHLALLLGATYQHEVELLKQINRL